jgi:hypothetical protein
VLNVPVDQDPLCKAPNDETYPLPYFGIKENVRMGWERGPASNTAAHRTARTLKNDVSISASILRVCIEVPGFDLKLVRPPDPSVSILSQPEHLGMIPSQYLAFQYDFLSNCMYLHQ